MHLQIHDSCAGLLPGSLVPQDEDARLETALRRFLGTRAATSITTRVGLSGARSLTVNELVSAGVGRKTAESLVKAREFGELLRQTPDPVDNADGLTRHLPPGLRFMETEVVFAFALDGKNHVKALLLIALGGQGGTGFTMADLFRPLVRFGARAFALAHNHPSGDPTPSREDILLTNAAARAGLVLHLPLVDHVIVAREGTASLFELGLLPTDAELHAKDGAP